MISHPKRCSDTGIAARLSSTNEKHHLQTGMRTIPAEWELLTEVVNKQPNHGKKTNEMKVKKTRDGRRDKTYQPCGDLYAAPAAALRASATRSGRLWLGVP